MVAAKCREANGKGVVTVRTVRMVRSLSEERSEK